MIEFPDLLNFVSDAVDAGVTLVKYAPPAVLVVESELFPTVSGL